MPADSRLLVRLSAVCLALPEAVCERKGDHASFSIRKKVFAYFLNNHHGDGRLAIWCKAPPGAQADLVEADSSRFFVPPYVGPSGWIGVRLEGKADWDAVASCLQEGYRMTAPKRLLAAGSGATRRA